MLNQEMDMKSMVDVMKATGDLYVDVIENVQCVLNSSVCHLDMNYKQSQIVNSSIEGTIQCKNQLEARPRFHIQLNKNIVKGKGTSEEPNCLYVDDMNYHPSVDVEEFEQSRRLSLTGPEGEFSVMNYRSTHPFYPPIMIQPSVEQVSEYKLDVVLKITTNFSAELKCDEMLISFHTPAITSSCKCELPEDAKKQMTDYSDMKHLVMWKVADAPGQTAFFLHVIIMLTKPCDAFTVKSMGPIS